MNIRNVQLTERKQDRKAYTPHDSIFIKFKKQAKLFYSLNVKRELAFGEEGRKGESENVMFSEC